jgi:FixJ family two-component response regulator
VPDQKPKIVVVEDDASMRLAIERILTAGGFCAATFESAEAALAAGAAATACCLVLDIHLPGMSGFDLCRHVAACGGEVPTIFITAHDEKGVRETAEEVGAAGYLPKPFSGRALLGAVKRALRPG